MVIKNFHAGGVMIRTIEDLPLATKIAFLRADFNVPLQDGEIAEPHRIDSTLPTIRGILQRAKKIVIASHLGRPEGKVIRKIQPRAGARLS